ncbi:biotin--[acetyl-CoA-carboxylase] ligase [Treponema zioleckii]|uniref:biotin--[acetyl-CoA-carboxylase] ligase n=1 Tax=Treponema zioleckii TaxID=331680 RepID=UPI00168BB35F|nr:biotin--[acetyl-CoA-carboxylase] ligase [Treponema zioleckii]
MANTKEKILDFLNDENFISGESLAEKCAVSRTAIHKAISALREDGYQIEAVTNKGYKITSVPDKIDESEILRFLDDLGTSGIKVHTFTTIDSTNTEAMRRATATGAFRDEKGSLTNGGEKLHKALFVSGEQTAGKGRLGRTFVSPPNAGVYFSFVFSPKNGVKNPALLTSAAAVAVAKSINELYCEKKELCGIKWVNDVFFAEKKITGILTEGITNFESGTIEAAIVGIGINVRPAGLTGDLAKIVGNIEEGLLANNLPKRKIVRNELVAHVIHYLTLYYEAFEQSESEQSKLLISEMMDFYKKNSILIGKTLKVNPTAGINQEGYMATVKDITKDAELVVELENGERKILHSGEVSLHSYDFV